MLEVIGFTLEGLIRAQEAGAQRIEICDNPGEGGTTPSAGFIKIAKRVLSIPLFPIIRPRGGDFFYSEEEYEMMVTDVLICKNLECAGVVIGILTREGEVDFYKTKKLVELAHPMQVTFHRAFDRVADPFQALGDLIDCGCSRVLTSGQKPDALSGAGMIAKLIEEADNRIIIMPGSGVTSENILEIKRTTGATEFHSSARKKIPGRMTFNNPDMNENLESFSVDEDEIKRMLAVLNTPET